MTGFIRLVIQLIVCFQLFKDIHGFSISGLSGVSDVCGELGCFDSQETCQFRCFVHCLASNYGGCSLDISGRRQFNCNCLENEMNNAYRETAINVIPDMCGELGCFTDVNKCRRECPTRCQPQDYTCVLDILQQLQYSCQCYASSSPTRVPDLLPDGQQTDICGGRDGCYNTRNSCTEACPNQCPMYGFCEQASYDSRVFTCTCLNTEVFPGK